MCSSLLISLLFPNNTDMVYKEGMGYWAECAHTHPKNCGRWIPHSHKIFHQNPRNSEEVLPSFSTRNYFLLGLSCILYRESTKVRKRNRGLRSVMVWSRLWSKVFWWPFSCVYRIVQSTDFSEELTQHIWVNYTDVHYPTPTGCLFSWLVWTTHQDAIKMPWLSSELFHMSWTLLRALMGNNTMNAL